MKERKIVSFHLYSLGDVNRTRYQDIGVVLTLEEEIECRRKNEREERNAIATLAAAKLLNHIKDNALDLLEIDRAPFPDILVK